MEKSEIELLDILGELWSVEPDYTLSDGVTWFNLVPSKSKVIDYDVYVGTDMVGGKIIATSASCRLCGDRSRSNKYTISCVLLNWSDDVTLGRAQEIALNHWLEKHCG